MSTISSVAYVVEGATMMPLNALLALTILCDKDLRRRKEFVLIVALAFADVLFGFGTLLTGSFRIYASTMMVAAGNTTIPMVSPWSCFFTVRQMLVVYAGEVSISLMTAISIERLIAVAWFQLYLKIGFGQITAWAIVVFTAPLVPLSYATYQVYVASVQGALYSATCTVGPPDWYAVYHNWFSGMMGVVSVVLYGAVLVAYRKVRAKVTSTRFIALQNKAQNRLTITLAIITFFTLIFHSIPFGVVTVMQYVHSSMMLAPYAWMLVRINSLIHVFVIYWRQKEVRKSMGRLFNSKVHSMIISVSPAVVTTQN